MIEFTDTYNIVSCVCKKLVLYRLTKFFICQDFFMEATTGIKHLGFYCDVVARFYGTMENHDTQCLRSLPAFVTSRADSSQLQPQELRKQPINE